MYVGLCVCILMKSSTISLSLYVSLSRYLSLSLYVSLSLPFGQWPSDITEGRGFLQRASERGRETEREREREGDVQWSVRRVEQREKERASGRAEEERGITERASDKQPLSLSLFRGFVALYFSLFI